MPPDFTSTCNRIARTMYIVHTNLDILTAQVSVTCIGDKVTDCIVKESSTAIFEDSHVCLFNEVGVRILVLRYDLCNSSDIAVYNFEVKGCQ